MDWQDIAAATAVILTAVALLRHVVRRQRKGGRVCGSGNGSCGCGQPRR